MMKRSANVASTAREWQRRLILTMCLCAIAAMASHCLPTAEGCMWQDLDVWIHAAETEGPSPLTVSLTAHGQGFACGCCGGRDSTEIISYMWDLDGDGTSDEEGPDLTEMDYTFEELGDHTVYVKVIDTAGDNAQGQITLTVTD